MLKSIISKVLGKLLDRKQATIEQKITLVIIINNKG